MLPELGHDSMSVQSNVFHALINILDIRRQEPCFHPDNQQQVVELGAGLFAFYREDKNSQRCLLAVHNLTAVFQKTELPQAFQNCHDLLSEAPVDNLVLKPYQCLWLVSE